MNYSWTKFVLGIIAGMTAIVMLSVTPPHFYLAMFLMFASTTLTTQGRDRAHEPEPVPAELDDWHAWRKTGREFVHGLPASALNITFLVAFTLLWDAAVKRYPLISRREIIVPILFAVAWIPQVIAAFRRGKSRNESAHPYGATE